MRLLQLICIVLVHHISFAWSILSGSGGGGGGGGGSKPKTTDHHPIVGGVFLILVVVVALVLFVVIAVFLCFCCPCLYCVFRKIPILQRLLSRWTDGAPATPSTTENTPPLDYQVIPEQRSVTVSDRENELQFNDEKDTVV